MQWDTRLLRGIAFTELEKIQEECVAAVKADPQRAYLLVSEPAATYTHGRSAKPEHFLLPAEKMAELRASVSPVSRGGQWTFHGPGQIVVYPIAHLRSLGYQRRAIAEFLDDLRDGIAQFLLAHGISAEVGHKPFGLFVSGQKIVSFGIAAHHGIISHGVALYLTPQAAAFRGIHPCGVPGAKVVSMAELGVSIPWETGAAQLIEHIKKGFKRIKNSIGSNLIVSL